MFLPRDEEQEGLVCLGGILTSLSLGGRWEVVTSGNTSKIIGVVVPWGDQWCSSEGVLQR